jgi:hypothetical protein
LPDSTAVLDEPVLSTALAGLLARLSAGPAVDPAASALVDQAVAVLRRPGFDTLLSLPQLAFEPFDYQRETAATVLRRMRGRAILADEVGLGKTIEAGLILSELRLRGLAERTLVVTPAGLVEQWRDELERKFSLPTSIVTARSGIPDCHGGGPVLLVSLATARRVGSGGRGRGTPAAVHEQRVREADQGAHRAVPAAVDRHSGGEPAAGPVRDDLSGGSRVARHPGPVPHPLRRCR